MDVKDSRLTDAMRKVEEVLGDQRATVAVQGTGPFPAAADRYAKAVRPAAPTVPTQQEALVLEAAAKSAGLKFDEGKVRIDLLDTYALQQIAAVLTFGAKKYAAHNWRKGIQISRLMRAGVNHMLDFNAGEDNDPETGLSHLAHAGCCVMFALWMMKNRPDMDDRWKGDTNG